MYIYIQIYLFSFSAIEKKNTFEKYQNILIFIFNKFFLFNWKLLLKNMFEKYQPLDEIDYL